MSRIIVWVAGVAVLVAMSSRDAAAQNEPLQGYATAHVGVTAGGDVPDNWRTLGGSVAIVEDSGWGAEMDLGYASHKAAGADASVGTFMINLTWVSPKGATRPFAVAGAGAMRLDGCLEACAATRPTTDLGLNVGAGTFVRLNDIVGVRGDARYFWAPGDHPDQSRPDNYGFWRASVGVTLQWTVVP